MTVLRNILMISWMIGKTFISILYIFYTYHGLALCCNVNKVNIIEVTEMPSVLEVLPIALEIEKEAILLLMV